MRCGWRVPFDLLWPWQCWDMLSSCRPCWEVSACPIQAHSNPQRIPKEYNSKIQPKYWLVNHCSIFWELPHWRSTLMKSHTRSNAHRMKCRVKWWMGGHCFGWFGFRSNSPFVLKKASFDSHHARMRSFPEAWMRSFPEAWIWSRNQLGIEAINPCFRSNQPIDQLRDTMKFPHSRLPRYKVVPPQL